MVLEAGWVPFHAEEEAFGKDVLLRNERRQGEVTLNSLLRGNALRPVTTWKDVEPSGETVRQTQWSKSRKAPKKVQPQLFMEVQNLGFNLK